MNLVKEQNKKRLNGALLGTLLPIILLLIVSLYGFFVKRPFVIGDNSFAAAPSSYWGVVWVYFMSVNYFQVFFCLSANMLAVWLLTNKNKNLIANGVILPTAIFALVLVIIRLV